MTWRKPRNGGYQPKPTDTPRRFPPPGRGAGSDAQAPSELWQQAQAIDGDARENYLNLMRMHGHLVPRAPQDRGMSSDNATQFEWYHRDDETPCPDEPVEGEGYGTRSFVGWFCSDHRQVERYDGLDGDGVRE